MPAIATSGLRKAFGPFVAVEHVSFEVGEGENFALLGPNGAGKSTLIRMLTTLLEPTSGRAQVAGFDVLHEADRVRAAIGVIPQALTSDPDLTAEENLAFFARLYRVHRSDRQSLTEELLESVDLLEWRHKLVGTFSGGMRRRLEIARSLIHRPRVLFLDEPTTGLDPASRQAMWAMIRRLKTQTGLTIFLTTHYMEEAEHLCDRVAIFDHGRIVALGTPAELQGHMSPPDALEVRFGAAPADWPERLAALPAVTTVEPLAEGWRLTSRDRPLSAAALLALCRERGVDVHTLLVRNHTLEDVFLQYTGRDLRDAADSKRRLDVSVLHDRRGGMA